MAREVNERVLEVARTFGELVPHENSLLSFVCECTRAECYERLELTRSEYEQAHAQPDRFVILDTHPLVADEVEVARTDRFVVVSRPDAAEPRLSDLE